jgi:topoisomerase IA-like protein
VIDEMAISMFVLPRFSGTCYGTCEQVDAVLAVFGPSIVFHSVAFFASEWPVGAIN